MLGRGAGTRRRRQQANTTNSTNTSNASAGLSGLQDHIDCNVTAGGGNGTHAACGAPRPHHCPQQKQICPGVNAVSLKQRKQIKLFSRLTTTPEPDVDSMDFGVAARWLGGLWHAWDAQGNPLK